MFPKSTHSLPKMVIYASLSFKLKDFCLRELVIQKFANSLKHDLRHPDLISDLIRIMRWKLGLAGKWIHCVWKLSLFNVFSHFHILSHSLFNVFLTKPWSFLQIWSAIKEMAVSKLAARLGRKVLPLETTSGLISFPVEGPALSNKAYTPVRSLLKILKLSNQVEGASPYFGIWSSVLNSPIVFAAMILYLPVAWIILFQKKMKNLALFDCLF